MASALRHAVASFPGDATVDIRTFRRFDPEVERAVCFCLTEALQNALKHGGDEIHVRLVLDCDEAELRFAVCDDGLGFDPAARSLGVGSETWSSGSALSVGSSPSARRSAAAPESRERCRPTRFALAGHILSSSQRHRATRAGNLALRRPSRKVDLSTEVGAGSTRRRPRAKERT